MKYLGLIKGEKSKQNCTRPLIIKSIPSFKFKTHSRYENVNKKIIVINYK